MYIDTHIAREKNRRGKSVLTRSFTKNPHSQPQTITEWLGRGIKAETSFLVTRVCIMKNSCGNRVAGRRV